MADERQIREFALLQRLMPPPAPSVGWGVARQQIEAQALGVLTDDQATETEKALALSAHQVLTSGAWEDDEFLWIFAIENVIGATGKWLDAWGKVLAVPRIPSEVDTDYAKRILIEIASPLTTNPALATAIDRIMGVTGTDVLDAETAYGAFRFNASHRYNDGSGILGFYDPAPHALSACFFIRMVMESTIIDRDAIARIVERRKAAGTRLIGISRIGIPVPIPPPDPALIYPSQFNVSNVRFNQGRPYEPAKASPVLYNTTGHRMNTNVRANQGA